MATNKWFFPAYYFQTIKQKSFAKATLKERVLDGTGFIAGHKKPLLHRRDKINFIFRFGLLDIVTTLPVGIVLLVCAIPAFPLLYYLKHWPDTYREATGKPRFIKFIERLGLFVIALIGLADLIPVLAVAAVFLMARFLLWPITLITIAPIAYLIQALVRPYYILRYADNMTPEQTTRKDHFIHASWWDRIRHLRTVLRGGEFDEAVSWGWADYLFPVLNPLNTLFAKTYDNGHEVIALCLALPWLLCLAVNFVLRQVLTLAFALVVTLVHFMIKPYARYLKHSSKGSYQEKKTPSTYATVLKDHPPIRPPSTSYAATQKRCGDCFILFNDWDEPNAIATYKSPSASPRETSTTVDNPSRRGSAAART